MRDLRRRLDDWLHRLSTFLKAEERTEDEQLRLGHNTAPSKYHCSVSNYILEACRY
jgi:hypothetical protein